MHLTLRHALLGIAFLIVYGVVVFSATRAYYLDRQVATAQPATGQAAASPAVPARPVFEPLADDPVALSEQADRMFSAKRYAEAEAAYRKLLTLQPGDGETLNDLGLVLHFLGRTQEALLALEQGVAAVPGFQRIWLTLGFVRLQAGLAGPAREAFERSIALDADSPIADEARRLLGSLR